MGPVRNASIVIDAQKLSSQPTTVEELVTAILANPEAVVFVGVGDPERFYNETRLQTWRDEHKRHKIGWNQNCPICNPYEAKHRELTHNAMAVETV